MHFPYFRFSTEQPRVEDLVSWALHFEDLGIACAIVEGFNSRPHPCDNKAPTFSLWRMGEENTTSPARKPNTEKLRGVVVKAYLGFSKNWRETEAV